MAKKQTTKVEVEQPQTKATNEMVEVVIEKPQPKKPDWEIKDRMYYLKNNKKPLSKMVKSAGIFWFDEEKGFERENIFYEHKPIKVAENQLDWLEFEVEAMVIARGMDVDMAEAIMRVEIGSEVTKMSSKELRRDLLLFAKKNPKLFLELTTDDNVMLRNFGIKAVEARIIKLSGDQRNFMWSSNDRKIMTVPFDEHPYSALAAWFKTDEGMEIYSNIEKRLNA